METQETCAPENRHLLFDLTPGERRGSVTSGLLRIAYGLRPASASRKGTIVLIHGAASNASRWEEFVETTALHHDWDLLRMDLRGHGASDTTEKATLETHARDIRTILKAEGVERAVFLGHSLGAQVAMHLASDTPELVSGLVLMDPLVQEALTPKARVYRHRRPALYAAECAGRCLNALGIRRTLPHYSLREHDRRARAMIAQGGEALEAFVKEFSSPLVDLRHMHLANFARDLLEVGRPSPDLSSLRAPVLVLCASNGAYTDPERMRRWTQSLPSGESDLVECVHWPMTECPDRVKSLVEAWAQRSF